MADHDDKAVFRAAMRGVKPLKPSNKHYFSKPKLPSRASPSEMQPTNHRHEPTPVDAFIESFSAEQRAENFPQQVSHEIRQRLQRGLYKIDAQCDLHGLNRHQAYKTLDFFIQSHFIKHCQCVLIIHGKGQKQSHGHAVLKSFIIHHLKHHELVRCFCSAKAKHGGTGALYVLLKNRR